jgi:plastocyanin
MKKREKKGYIQGKVSLNLQKRFDSRTLGPCDAYFRLLRKPEDYDYKITSLEQKPPVKKLAKEPAKKEALESRVESINIYQTDEEGIEEQIGVRLNRFNKPVIPRKLPAKLPTNSIIMWHKVDTFGPDIKIEGVEGKQKKFTNQKLNHHDGYSHTFLFPGKYRYHNGKPDDKCRHGVIIVKPLKKEEALSLEGIPKPVIVRCNREGFDPPEITIITGQTVGWLIYDIGVAIIQEEDND